MRRLFILRPESGAASSLEGARAIGLDAVSVPLFRIEPVAWQAPGPASFDALLLTSANAIHHAGDELAALRGLPAYAVGEATANAARDAGLDIAGSGDLGVERLLGSIEPDLRLLHLAGEDRRSPAGARQQIVAITVYRSTALLRPAGIDAITGQVAAIHSPRAGERLAALLDEATRATVRLACISEGAAAAAGDCWDGKQAADRPTDAAVLALAARLCEKPVDR